MKNKIEYLLNKICRVMWCEPFDGTYEIFHMWYNSAPRWYRWLRREKIMYRDGEVFIRMRENDLLELELAIKKYVESKF